MPLDNASAMDDISNFFYFTNKLLPEVARYALTPQSGFKDDFTDITEDGLIQTLGTSDDVRAYLQQAFGLIGSKLTSTELRSVATRQKVVFIASFLFSLSKNEADGSSGHNKHGYQATVRRLNDQESISRPYVLDGTFRTNSQVLQLMTIDTRKAKLNPPKAVVTPICDDDDSADGYNPSFPDKSRQGVDKLLENVEKMFPDLDAVDRQSLTQHRT
ncbi:hypothetical protein Unana1_08912 [Umbelopsis nana]